MTQAAGANQLSDLLFSPRAAFIWSHARQTVAWMNPAARAAFTLRLDDFSASLPKRLKAEFERFIAKREGGFTKIKLRGAPALHCSVELLRLADGQDGLIVAELSGGEEAVGPPALSAPLKRAVARKPSSRSTRRRKTTVPEPLLTSAEMRAFKSLGRKVLRLSEDKEAGEGARFSAACPPSEHTQRLGRRAVPEAKQVLAAFDLVLFLSEARNIVDSRGRAGRLGWSKAKLTGLPAPSIFPRRDRASLDRMMRKLDRPGAHGCRDSLTILREDGSGARCRAFLGHWKEGKSCYYLALVSLAAPEKAARPGLRGGRAKERLAA